MNEEIPDQIQIEALLHGFIKHNASDLHLKAGSPPMYRVHGNLVTTKLPALSPGDAQRLIYTLMTDKQIAQFEEKKQLDFGYTVPNLARFRVNIFMQRGTISSVVRLVPLQVPSFDNLGLPSILKKLALRQQGLILVTGSTGAGKSSTLAAMIEYLNRKVRGHVITLEDPIEFLFQDKTCSITQREIGLDTNSMSEALVACLRQDPDVIVVGEMRDFETIQTALTAAETGHLVISTLHTNNAVQTIDRIIDCFPAEAKNQIRIQLASSLLAIVSQQLIPKRNGQGLTVACEIMIKSPTVERLIFEGQIGKLEEHMEASSNYYGMQTMNQALSKMAKSQLIKTEDALRYSLKPEDLRLKLSGMKAAALGDVQTEDYMKQVNRQEKEIDFAGVNLGSPIQLVENTKHGQEDEDEDEDDTTIDPRKLKKTGNY